MNVNTQRKTLTAMAASYSLGVFNDNFFKQAAMLLAVAAGLEYLQGWAAMLFALPFLLFSAQGGWCADRFSKKSVIVCSKALEIIAMLVGTFGLIKGSWPLILGMIFTMGMQSAFFGPSLNGSIPEQCTSERVPKINALYKLISTTAILAGMATAGVSLDQKWFDIPGISFGIALVCAIVLTVSLLGFVTSFAMVGKAPVVHAKKRSFPWLGPVNSIKDIFHVCRDRELRLAIVADTWFYFLASTIILAVNSYSMNELGFSRSLTSLVSTSLMAGVCAGSFLAAKIVAMHNWSAKLIVSSLGMALGLLLTGATTILPPSVHFYWLATALFFSGTAGGLFLIPITSFLQIHPEKKEKGRVLATAGFCSFCAILFSGFIYTIMESIMLSSQLLTALGLLALLVTSIFAFTVHRKSSTRAVLGFMLRRILSLRYKIDIKGLDKLDLDNSKGTIFLPNHPALIDPVIIMSTLHDRYRPRPLSAAEQVDKPIVRHFMKLVRPILLPEVKAQRGKGKPAAFLALDEVVEALRSGENVLFYPAGRLTRSGKEELGANSGLEYIVKHVPDLQTVLVRSTGLWGSSFSRAGSTPPRLIHNFLHSLKALFANGIFFSPRRQVTVEFHQDTRIVDLKSREAINPYIERYYNQNSNPAMAVPYYWWQGSKPEQVETRSEKDQQLELTHIPDSIKDHVCQKLSGLSGCQVAPQQRLAADLGLDSITILELAGWLEQEFGTLIEDPALLERVDDCILAAAGQLSKNPENTVKPPPASWFEVKQSQLQLPEGNSITACFLQQAARKPSTDILADEHIGTRNYTQIITAIHALLPTLQGCSTERVGILLPASGSAAIVYLAALFAGKTPVLFNWTSGISNMAHGIKETGVKQIITATPLTKKIEQQQGIDLQTLDIEWLYLDSILANLTIAEKLHALVMAKLFPGRLAKRKVPETAAILFTSGSEARPKAVPLSNENIMANLRDFSSVLGFAGSTRLLGLLPPFHSLGLVGNIIMPLCLGLPTVYHANPTEPARMAQIIQTFKVSMVISTPTFLHGILQVGDLQQLRTLKLAFTGAESCPEHVRELLNTKAPLAELCEGYGITECSPLVSMNIPGNSRPGTIGRILPSVEYAIVDEEIHNRVDEGSRGQLLVRGSSIFSGYLNDTGHKGFCEFEGKQWYQTGDYVEMQGGYLIFRGRQKRFIKIAGEMISLPAIEQVLLQDVQVQNNDGPVLAVEATPTDSHPEIVLFATHQFQREELNTTIRQAGLSALHNIRRIVKVDAIPVLGTGKTDYTMLRQTLCS